MSDVVYAGPEETLGQLADEHNVQPTCPITELLDHKNYSAGIRWTGLWRPG